MINFLSKMFGFDQKILIFLSSRAFSYLSYPITLTMIIKFLSPEQQGYYYTFLTLLGLSMFLELGLGIILTNFASHEFSNLKWDKNNNLIGNSLSLGRSYSLIQRTIFWFISLAILFFILMVGVGIFFFGEFSLDNSIFLSWVLFLIVFSPGLIISPLLSILQGFQKIKEVQFVIFLQVFFSILFFWIALLYDLGLNALVVQFLVQNIISFLYLLIKYPSLIIKSLSSSNNLFSWRQEVLPLQIKTGFTWLVSYLGLNLLVPFSFKIFGPVIAGQLGMSFKISEIVSIICLAWVNTRVPEMGQIIAKNNIKQFNKLFYSTLRSVVIVGALFSVSIFGLLSVIDNFGIDNFLNRILPINFIMLLIFGYYMFSISNYFSMTIRAFKDEKMIMPNLIALFVYIVAISASLTLNDYKFLIISFFITNFFIILPFSILFIRKTLQEKEFI